MVLKELPCLLLVLEGDFRLRVWRLEAAGDTGRGGGSVLTIGKHGHVTWVTWGCARYCHKTP